MKSANHAAFVAHIRRGMVVAELRRIAGASRSRAIEVLVRDIQRRARLYELRPVAADASVAFTLQQTSTGLPASEVAAHMMREIDAGMDDDLRSLPRR
jgi:hypothetical protein